MKKRTTALGEILSNFIRTLFAPAWIPMWCLGWVTYSLDDSTTPTFWPPWEQHYLIRQCGHLADTREEVEAHDCGSATG